MAPMETKSSGTRVQTWLPIPSLRSLAVAQNNYLHKGVRHAGHQLRRTIAKR